MTYTESGRVEFVGALPPFSLHEPMLRICFDVASEFAGDGRELGVCVPLPNGGIPFNVC